MMKKTISLLLSLMLVMSFSPFVMAYDSSTPYTVTLNWIVPADTTFTVALAGAETTIDFNPANKSDTAVMPDSQADVTPIITITNQGNVNANYSAQVTQNKPSWVTLKGYNTYTYGSAVEITNTTTTTIEDSIAPSGTSEYWLWSDFSNAPSGTEVSTFQISTVEA
jgi:hypothetical protein